MRPQNKFYTLLAVLLVGILAWLYFYYLPTLEKINQYKATLLTYNTKINSASKASTKIEEIEQLLEDMKSELTRLEQKIVDKSQLENFAKLMESEARKYNMTIINVSPVVNYYFKISEINPTGTYISRLPFEMNLITDFMSFAKFLDNLDNLPIYIHLEGVEMDVSHDEPTKLSIHLMSSVYVKTGKEDES